MSPVPLISFTKHLRAQLVSRCCPPAPSTPLSHRCFLSYKTSVNYSLLWTCEWNISFLLHGGGCAYLRCDVPYTSFWINRSGLNWRIFIDQIGYNWIKPTNNWDLFLERKNTIYSSVSIPVTCLKSDDLWNLVLTYGEHKQLPQHQTFWTLFWKAQIGFSSFPVLTAKNKRIGGYFVRSHHRFHPF